MINDKEFSQKYPSGNYLRNMTQLHNLSNYPDQFLMSNYTFDLQLCQKTICDLCPTCHIQNPITAYGHLQRRVLYFMALHIVEMDDKETFLVYQYAINGSYWGLVRAEKLKYLKIVKGVYAEKNLLNDSKSMYKANLKEMLHYSKAQFIIHCGECGTETENYNRLQH